MAHLVAEIDRENPENGNGIPPKGISPKFSIHLNSEHGLSGCEDESDEKARVYGRLGAIYGRKLTLLRVGQQPCGAVYSLINCEIDAAN